MTTFPFRSWCFGLRRLRACLLAATLPAIAAAPTAALAQTPVVTGVAGCLDSASTTAECPTLGSVDLTISGTDFGIAEGNVWVGSSPCPVVPTSWVDTSIKCTLPQGAGLDQHVVVQRSGGEISLPFQGVSYAAPSIAGISGCPGAGCPRAGGTTITITGTNFGPPTGTVLVGGANCGGAVYSHTQVQCTMPPGVGQDRSVIVIQNGGEPSPTPGTISYEPCPAGTHIDGISCTNCTPGSFSDTLDATSCSLCPAGSAQPSSGQTSCIPCATGSSRSSQGAATCSPCTAGSFADHVGALTCESCAPGTFQADPGQDSCDPCPPGRFQPLSGQDDCAVCTPGTYAEGGAAACTLCAPGSAQGSTEASSCVPCLRG